MNYNKDGSRKSIRQPRVIRGYTQLPNAIAFDRRLSSDARFLYWLLCAHSRPERPLSWPGQQRLAELSGWQTRSGQWDRWRVQRALDELEDNHLIRRERRGGRTNRYILLPAPEELQELLITDDSEVTAPMVMRKQGSRTQRKSASQQCASDAHRSEADFQHESGGSLRKGAQHEIADQDGNSPQFSAPFCAQRIYYSSLKGGESSSSVDAVNEDFDQSDGSHVSELTLSQGQLDDRRCRCLRCGWTGLAVELLPRRFEGESRLTLLCPNCRWAVEKDFNEDFCARELKKSDCRRCKAPGQWPYGVCDECRKAMVREALNKSSASRLCTATVCNSP